MKKDIFHKRGMIEGMNKKQATLKGELSTLSNLSEERAKEAANMNKELSSEKEALAAAASAPVQFATQKIREFLASPNYASQIHTECAAYLYSLASDYKSRFLYLVTLFGEEKADKPEWYGDLSLSDGDSSDVEAACNDPPRVVRPRG
ncbi:hypothetical protein LIER_43075 [Lithospermum erythrorhizon]|uniref:Uncharacterized protein n=1 Tax=Lithospermum erythrorhizon TaxID=34254 RepID=A0AAV3PHJ1_LITER